MNVDDVALRVIASSRARAPPVSCSVGAPDGALTTPISFMNTPRLKPVPTALEKASLAAKRLAKVPAAVNGRRAALARSTSVKTRLRNRSPKRSSEAWIRSILHRSEPMADDHRALRPSGARIRAHARLEPGEDRLADQEMADVELGQLRDCGDRRDIVEGQAVAGVRFDAVLGGKRGASAMRLIPPPLLARRMRVAAGVELDHRRAEPKRGLDLGARSAR